MDHSLIATSPLFESHATDGAERLRNAFAIFNHLGPLTFKSLEAKRAELSQSPAPVLPTSTQETDPTVEAKRKSPAVIQDKVILDALAELRNSDRFSRRSAGIYSPILRPTQT